MRGVRSGRGDEVPRARATATDGVRRELTRSRAGPRGRAHCCRVVFGACRHSFVSCICVSCMNCILFKSVYRDL